MKKCVAAEIYYYSANLNIYVYVLHSVRHVRRYLSTTQHELVKFVLNNSEVIFIATKNCIFYAKDKFTVCTFINV